jgi:enterochelin esterase family protein
MIIVMPFGHAVPFGVRMAGEQHRSLRPVVVKDVMPLIESARVAPGRESGHRGALHGLAGSRSPWGSGTWTSLEPSARRSRASKDVPARLIPRTINAKLKVLWFACGKQDSLFDRSQKFSELLASRQIKHTFRPTEGAHGSGAARPDNRAAAVPVTTL